MKNLILALFIMGISMPVMASEALNKGDRLPTSIEALENQDGESLKLYDLYGKKGMTLVFYRSAGWCPYCQKQLIDLNKNANKFEEAGYPLVGLSYDKAEILKRFDTKHDISFPLLSDPASEAIRAFGIMDDTYAKGTFAYGVPKPAIYIISDKGKVEKVFKEASYKDRPDVSSILNDIKPKPVFTGEEFPDDPSVDPGKVEVMEPTAAIVEEAPILIEAPASDSAIDAVAEINETTMEKTLDAMDMKAVETPEAVIQPIIEEKAPEIIVPEMKAPEVKVNNPLE